MLKFKNLHRTTLFIVFVCLFNLPIVQAQSSQVNKANKLYSSKNYGQAIPLYLAEIEGQEKPNKGVMTKLANCYRMTNEMEEAEKWYAQIVTRDKVKPEIFLRYGETLMGTGKYDEAKKWLVQYSELEPDDDTAKKMAESCDLVKHIKPMYTIYQLEAFPHNSDLDEMSPVFYGDDIIFSSDRKQGAKLLKQKSGWTDRDYIKVYSSTQLNDTLFSSPSPFSAKINELNKNTAGAAFWQDTTRNVTEIYFTRNSATVSKGNEYNMQLFRAESENGKNWKEVEVLYFCTNESNYMHPAISPDGKTLLFVSDKGKGIGGTDIYTCTRKKDGTWNRPENISANINTEGHEGFPFINAKNELFFCSKGHVGYGGFDIFKSTKKGGEWSAPSNVGKPINSAADDISICFSADGKRGAFTSSREGGDDDIYFFSLTNQVFKRQENKDLPTAIEKQVADKNEKTKGDLLDTAVASKDDMIAMPTDVNRLVFNDLKNNVEKTKLVEKQIYVLETVDYAAEEYVVSEVVSDELDELIQLLHDNPSLQIEIGSHTESLGEDKDNLTLSRYRAEAVVAYFKKNGIPDVQISAKGYGETMPLNHCKNEVSCSPKEHKLNRRMEVKILGY